MGRYYSTGRVDQVEGRRKRKADEQYLQDQIAMYSRKAAVRKFENGSSVPSDVEDSGEDLRPLRRRNAGDHQLSEKKLEVFIDLF